MRVLGVFLVGLALLCGCGKPKGKVLGAAPGGKPQNILAIRSGNTAANVTVSGVIIEKCPTAGCWFRLRDTTGVIKVDTKSAGFVVVNVPLESTVTVAGRVVSEGNEIQIEATGLRY